MVSPESRLGIRAHDGPNRGNLEWRPWRAPSTAYWRIPRMPEPTPTAGWDETIVWRSSPFGPGATNVPARYHIGIAITGYVDV